MLKLKFSDQDIAHMLLPRENVVYTYVVEDPTQKKVTDFFSFYILPSSILKKQGHNYDHVRAAYSLYNVAKVNPLHELMKAALL